MTTDGAVRRPSPHGRHLDHPGTTTARRSVHKYPMGADRHQLNCSLPITESLSILETFRAAGAGSTWEWT